MSYHNEEKLDKLLNKQVEIIFFDGSIHRGMLYDRETAQKQTGRILCNTPYFILSLDGHTLGFYKTHVKKLKGVAAHERKNRTNRKR